MHHLTLPASEQDLENDKKYVWSIRGGTLIVQFQVQIADIGRVDFLIHALDCGGEREEEWNWKQLIVECDGHDFHERTKEQAAKDKARDRQAQLAGYTVFRYTGSELWRDPWGRIRPVLEWGGA